ncbi:MAG TPA: hypothetical protein LFW13_04950 [Rickettsia endosymbiont of Sericostoma sp.]|nr:hypothetical protein [Rickettsia endosymbiont of Sericostoma sp.]
MRYTKHFIKNIFIIFILYSNDLENWNVKQGVSERSVHEVREHANTPKFYGANSSNHLSIPK